MTCQQLAGACDLEFTANTFEEIAEMSKKHAMEMIQKGDQAHLEAMNRMQVIMQNTNGMQEWIEAKRKEFDAL